MATLIFLICAIFLILFGFIVWIFKCNELVFGYAGNKLYHKDKLSKWIGLNFIFMGMLVLINIGISFLFNNLQPYYCFFSFIIIILLISLRLTKGCYKYEK